MPIRVPIRRSLILLVLTATCAAPAAQAEDLEDAARLKALRAEAAAPTPYTEVATQLKDEIEAILAGEEWGDDSVAAAYGYPSPAKAIRWSNRLQLTRAQENRIYQIHEDMTFWAKKIAPEFVKTEAELEELFRSGRANPAMIKRLTEKSATLRGQLRAIHLSARSKMRTQLTTEQLRAYALYRSGEG